MTADRVVGRNPVVEALRAGVPGRALHVAPGLARDQRIREVVGLATAAGIPVHETPRPRLDHLAGPVPHQGLVLEVAPFRYAAVDDLLTTAELLVALDGVTDPRNVGAVARSAAAFGAAGLLLPARRAAGVGPAVWKASAGAVARLPVAQVTNLTRALTSCADAGFAVVGLAADGRTPLDALDVSGERVVLVVGAEARGLSRLVRTACRDVVAIPMVGAESLNAAVAAAVVLAELARRRRAGTQRP